MSNRDKKYIRLNSLYKKHRELDDQIKVCYSTFTSEEKIKRLKTEKLSIKDEIQKIENELKE